MDFEGNPLPQTYAQLKGKPIAGLQEWYVIFFLRGIGENRLSSQCPHYVLARINPLVVSTVLRWPGVAMWVARRLEVEQRSLCSIHPLGCQGNLPSVCCKMSSPSKCTTADAMTKFKYILFSDILYIYIYYIHNDNAKYSRIVTEMAGNHQNELHTPTNAVLLFLRPPLSTMTSRVYDFQG